MREVDCSSCGAPLPPNKIVCLYCGTRNMVDLQSHNFSSAKDSDTVRNCPACNTEMETIDLAKAKKKEESFFIEKCPSCQGLFFDNEELQHLLEKKTATVSYINNERLKEISTTRITSEIVYRPCPVCNKLMNRVNFGARSGTIIDQCREHGLYLDGGELRQLLEWRKAGGHLVEKRSSELKRKEKEWKRSEASEASLKRQQTLSQGDTGGGVIDMLWAFFSR